MALRKLIMTYSSVTVSLIMKQLFKQFCDYDKRSRHIVGFFLYFALSHFTLVLAGVHSRAPPVMPRLRISIQPVPGLPN